MTRALVSPSDDDIREVAMAAIGDRLVIADQVPPDLLGSIFMPLTLGAFKDYTNDELLVITVFGIVGKHATFAMGVNGWPMFMECQIWPRDAMNRALDLARRMSELVP